MNGFDGQKGRLKNHCRGKKLLMKRYFMFIGGILLLLFGIGLGTIGMVTIVRIIQSGSADGLDIELSIIMAVLVVAGFLMAVLGSRLLRARISNRQPHMREEKDEKRQGIGNIKVWSVCLFIAAVVCIEMLFIFQKQFGLIMTFIFTGLFCIIAFGALCGIELKRSGKWEHPRQLQAVVGLPAIVYLIIVFFILEYVVGW